MNWISVKQRQPKEGEIVLVSTGVQVGIGFQVGNTYVYSGSIDGKVTHWMPLPEPPIEINLYDKETIIPNCTVQVLENSVTGAVSVGYWRENNDQDIRNAYMSILRLHS